MAKDQSRGWPEGWYPIAPIPDKGEIVSLKRFGIDLVLWNNGSDICLHGAQCPHMGGNLSKLSTIDGKCLVCPFHAWKFRPDGNKVLEDSLTAYDRDIYKNRIVFHVEIVNNWVMAWYPYYNIPAWAAPRFAEFENPGEEWSDYDSKCYDIKVPIEWAYFNGVDFQHFRNIHNVNIIDVKECNGYDSEFKAKFIQEVPFGEKRLRNNFDITIYGCSVSMVYMTGMVDNIIACGSVPIDQDNCMITLQWLRHTSNYIEEIKDVFYDEVKLQINKDIAVWENLIIKDNPLFVEEDKPILEFLRWVDGLNHFKPYESHDDVYGRWE